MHEKFKSLYLPCECGATEHTCRITRWDGEEQFSIEVGLTPILPFWDKIKVSFLFLFSKRYNCYTDTIIDKQTALELIKFLQKGLDEE